MQQRATSRRRRLFPPPRRAHSLARFQAGSFEPKPSPSLTPSPLVTPSSHPLRPTPHSPVPLAAAQHRAQVSDDYVAPVTLGVGRGAQTFLLVADTGSSAVAVVGDPNLGCLRYLDTSDRCDTNRHVECLYGSGGWRGVDCHREVALGGLAVRGYELAAVTWEQAFLMCPASPDEGQGAPLRRDMLIEGIFGLSLSGLRRGTLR